MKNIGIPQNKTYLLQMIENIEMVIKRMRWKVLCNVKKETNGIKREWYGLKSSKTPKQVKNFIQFENDFIALVQNIKFRKTINHFQKKINIDGKQVLKSKEVLNRLRKYFLKTLTWRHIVQKIPSYCKFNVLLRITYIYIHTCTHCIYKTLYIYIHMTFNCNYFD